MVKNNKKLLVINYYYPPIGGAGVKRVVKYVKFLPKNGWAPIVLTVESGNHPIKDSSLLQTSGTDIIVYRTFTFEYIFSNDVDNSPERAMSHYEDKSIRISPIRSMIKKWKM